MSRAILDALVANGDAQIVSTQTVSSFIDDHADRVTILFFTGDPEKKAETADVAVAVRELVRKYPDDLTLAIVAREDEAALMGDYNTTTVPSLAFYQGQTHLDTIARIQNWSVYEERIIKILGTAGRGKAA